MRFAEMVRCAHGLAGVRQISILRLACVGWLSDHLRLCMRRAATGLDDEIGGNLHFLASVKHLWPTRGEGRCALRGRISVFGSPTICSGLLLVHVGVWLPL